MGYVKANYSVPPLGQSFQSQPGTNPNTLDVPMKMALRSLRETPREGESALA